MILRLSPFIALLLCVISMHFFIKEYPVLTIVGVAVFYFIVCVVCLHFDCKKIKSWEDL